MKNLFTKPSQLRTGPTWAPPWVFAGRGPALLAALGIAFLAAAASATAQDIHDSLVVHLTFDGDVVDHTGRGNDGAIMRPGADSPFVAGIITNNRTLSAFRAQGDYVGPMMATNNYITLGNPDDLDFGLDTDFSFSWWGLIPPGGADNADPAWLANKDWVSGDTIGWVLCSQGTHYIDPKTGGFKWNYKNAGGSRSDSSRHADAQLNDGQWHHYVVVFTRQVDGVVYLDGQLTNEQRLSTDGDLTSGLPVNIFQDATGLYTDGDNMGVWRDASICDLGIWRRAITSDDVTTIFTQGQQGISALD